MRAQCVTTMYVCMHHNVSNTGNEEDDDDDDDISDCIYTVVEKG
jgi:hypothetical protein